MSNANEAKKMMKKSEAGRPIRPNRPKVTPFLHPKVTLQPLRMTCAHYHTAMRLFDPQAVIKYPYRPSLMNLLRRIRTTENDEVIRPLQRRDPVVLASFQMHWCKRIDVPVLTVVGCCDTQVFQPSFRRTHYRHGTMTLEVAHDSERHSVTFEVPIWFDAVHVPAAMNIDLIYGYDVSDKHLSYGIIPDNNSKPLLILNIFNLSNTSCHQMHLTSLVQLDGTDVADEHHILGLTGCRDTTFPIEYPSLEDPALFFLDRHDLRSIGYYNIRKPAPAFIKHEHPGDDNVIAIARMFPRMATTKADVQINTIKQKPNTWKYVSKHLIVPERYPHKQSPDEVQVRQSKPPSAFPRGYFPDRSLLNKQVRTMEDALEDFSTISPNNRASIDDFATFLNVPRSKLYSNLTAPFHTFLLEHCGITRYDDNKATTAYYREEDPTWWPPKEHQNLFYRFVTVVETVTDNLMDLPNESVQIPVMQPMDIQNNSEIVPIAEFTPKYYNPFPPETIPRAVALEARDVTNKQYCNPFGPIEAPLHEIELPTPLSNQPTPHAINYYQSEDNEQCQIIN